MGFPAGSVIKNPSANEGAAGSIPGSGRSLFMSSYKFTY